jgi:Putative phage tail protein
MNNLNELNTYALTSVDYEDETLGSQTLANRYTINGLVGTDATVLENLEKLCSSAGSWLSYDIHQGKWAIIVNKAGTSQYSFDDNNIIGPLRLSSTGIDQLYNSVKVSFPHEDLRNQTDFVTISIPSGDRYPNEVDNVLELNYGLVTNPVQAQLLGFIELKQNRVDKVVTLQTDYSKISVRAGDIIDITNEIYGFTNKLFRVITVKEVDDDDGNINIEIIALEYDSTVYDESNLTKYTRTDENGIVTLGNLIAPATPTVTKYETDSRPRIEITTSLSGGVADHIEFWISTDVPPAVTVDSNRTYNLLTTTKPTTGNIFPLSTNITVEVDSLSTSDFLIKAKALNHEFSSPFSSPSGVINYEPQQATDLLNLGTPVSNDAGSVSFSDLAQMAALSFAINGGVSLLGNIAGNVGTTLANTISTFFANTGILGNAISEVFSTGNTSQYPQGGNITVNNPQPTGGDGITVTNGVVSINRGVSLKGEIFPCLFGSNIYAGAYDSRTAVFTHKDIMFATGNAVGQVTNSTTSGTKSPTISLEVGDYGSSGQKTKTYSRYKWKVASKQTLSGPTYTYFFNANTAGGTGGTTLNPNWTGSAADSDGKIRIYYSTCSFDANLSLEDQAWSDWRPVISSDGITTTVGGTTITEYRVDIEGYSSISCATGTGPVNNAVSGISVPSDGIIAFGISNFNIANNTPFSGNTILGSKNSNTVTNYSFPGYTPASGHTANIQYTFLELNSHTLSTLNITQSSNLSISSNTSLTVNQVWPDDFQFMSNSTSLAYAPFNTPNTSSADAPYAIGITGCPTINIKI